MNLLNNACDAVEHLSSRWIELKVVSLEHSVVIEVIDSGTGIPQEIQEKMMRIFFTSKPVGKGTGLGLSISRAIIEDHGGTLKYVPTPTNTRFVIEFPRQIGDQSL